ncbi:uncharacterized protein [Triticum aestivum]|uniref:uncharacterized protein isoform X2 n=1 Tax=Triticum aestivum TaxID=4565 RepID=UPI001D02ADBF|nr:uncharacterized protein LOC123095193 isoform X2 [Triticum aestivum]
MPHEHEHPAAEDIPESDPDECVGVHVKKAELHIRDIHEAKLLIQELNRSGVGEDISDEEFLAYFDQLAPGPPWIDLRAGLTEEDLGQQYVDHALCRFRYYKYKLPQPKEEPHGDNLLEEEEDDKEEREYLATLTKKQLLFLEEDDATSEEDDNLMDKTEDDCSMEFLEEKGFFISFEEDGTLDWFFYSAYCECASLSDYQRLVLKNYGGTEYSMWSVYPSYRHSYDIEREYLKYCQELSKQLKWMEDYVDICRSSVKWGKISSRGAFQAIKIAATSFPKITPTLAYNGFDYKERICYYHTWFKEYDRLYFEIWRRVTKGTSFRKAMEDVCKMNKFPVRQGLMQTALDHEYTMTLMEEDFHTCTAAIRPGVKEDKAKELIADGVKKLVNMPKSYEDYIRKKIEIACITGILPSEKTEATV